MCTGAASASAGIDAATASPRASLDAAKIVQRLAQPVGHAGTAQRAQLATGFTSAQSVEGGIAAVSAGQLAPATDASHREASLEEAEERLEDGSLKQAIFAILKAAGPAGLAVSQIMEHLKLQGFSWGTNPRAAKSSISSTCSHDNMFLRLEPGKFTLAALPGAKEHMHASAGCSRQELEVCPNAFAPCTAVPARLWSGCRRKSVSPAPEVYGGHVCVVFRLSRWCAHWRPSMLPHKLA